MNQTTYSATGVIYARYSSHSQRDVSIDQQVRACEAFAERQDIKIQKIYEDRAATGTTDKRPGFQQMIQDAKKSGWNYVIVYTLDRFARDRYDSAVYKRQLKNHGIKVLSAMENISDDPTGILMESMLEGLAEYYSKELSRKVQRGQNDNARKCLVNGALPLGYIKGSDGKYHICESEADVVREIFRRVNDGDSFANIIGDLNDRGIVTKTGKRWTHSSFNRILSNERYTGVYIYRDIRIPGGVPQIVPQRLFDSVQSTLHQKANARRDPSGCAPQKRRRDNSVYLLTGKLFCGHCKSPMIGLSGTSHTNAAHHYYTCKGRRVNAMSCDKRNLRRDEIEQRIAQDLCDTMLTDEAIVVLATAAVAYQRNNNSARTQLATMQSRLADTNRSLKNLMAAIESGIFSETSQASLLELEVEKRELTKLIAATEADMKDELTAEEIIATLQLFQNGDIHDKAFQEAMIDTFLVAAYVYDDRIKYVFNLGGDTKDGEIPIDVDSLVPKGSSYKLDPAPPFQVTI